MMIENQNASLYDFISNFTDAYRRHSVDEAERRELACLRLQFPFVLQPIKQGDLFAGRITHAPVGFAPQMHSGFGYYVNEADFLQMIDSNDLSAVQKVHARRMLQFWKNEQTRKITRDAYPPHMAELLPSDNWNGESGIAFPLYRMAGSNLNYERLLTLGISGLRDVITARQKKPGTDAKSHELFTAMQMGLELLRDVCTWYAEAADVLAMQTADKAEAANYSRIAETLNHIAYFPPETFHQALQLFWMYALLSGNADYGRIDIWAADFYARDRRENNLSQQEALEMLLSLWQLIAEREGGAWVFDSRVIIGGMGRGNEKWADELALLCIEATRRRHDVLPQLTLRFYKAQNPKLYEKALDCIAENNPYPLLYNDDVNIPAAEHAFEISHEQAVDYVPFGCGEYIIDHQSFGTPSGVLNMLHALLVTLHNGVDPTTGKTMGLQTGDPNSFTTFEDLYTAYLKQLEAHVQVLAEQEILEYQMAGRTAPFLFFSMLYENCIERGRAVFDGGVKYLGGTLETYGNTNAADSLLAVKKLVYDEKKMSLAEMVNILDADFAGFERERKTMLDLAKYGNDENEADEMLLRVDRDVFAMVREQAQRVGLHSYLVVVINNNANTVMGRYTAASPDGRPAFTPMNNGNNPSSGMDKNGVTAFLNSIVKPPVNLAAGLVQNMKFSKDLFAKHPKEIEQLLSVYWAKGGAQAMITVIGRDDLQNAIKNPQEYQNLIVRVGGYSARFVDLDADIQQEILNRTLY